MALINLTTNLRSLRYGNDRRGSADSGQPYVQTSIPDGNINGGLGDEDFLLRGGSLLPATIANDVSRLTKMFFDFKSPNGLLFTAKQEVLSRSGVNIKANAGTGNKLALNNGLYLPTSTILQAGVNPLGGHLLKQGINPFANTNTVGQSNIFSTGFGGAFPLANPIYLDTDAYNERQNFTSAPTSRLVSFYDSKIQSNLVANDQVNLYSYSGGPGSTLGVGNTNILLSKERTGLNSPQLKGSGFFNTAVNFGYNDFSVFKRSSVDFQGSKIFNGKSVSSIYEDITGIDVLEFKYKTTNDGSGALRLFPTSVFQSGSFSPQAPGVVNGLGTTLNYDELQNAYSGSNQNLSNGGPNNVYNRSTTLQDFRQRRTANKGLPSVDYTGTTNKTLEGRVNLGNPGKSLPTNASYTKGVSPGGLDKITSYPIYSTTGVGNGYPDGIDSTVNDLVKFRIGVISNDNPGFTNYIHFRAFLDGMDDSYNSSWQAQKYSGRAENLYNYEGFDRTINLSWTVAAQSKEELIPMYQKLNYLASSLAPDYSSNGYMRGNLIKLTVGGYLYEQVGILKGISYTVPQESPWDISISDNGTRDATTKEMPMIIKVSGFQFIPIHDFVPQVQQNTFSPIKSKSKNADGTPSPLSTGLVNKFGKERYIALSRGGGESNNNYDS